MINSPSTIRAIVYVDGQNLFNAAKEAFGYREPNYDISKLAQTICAQQGWQLSAIHFYTGIPDPTIDPKRHHFWAAKLAVMGSRGIRTFARPLRYANQMVALPNGSMTTTLVGREKGIDIRLALDVVRDALENRYDVGLVFSQDQDLSEVADEVRKIAHRDNRWIKLVCAFPISPTSRNKRGINKTDWIKMDRALYDTCLDPMDYRAKKQS